MLRIYLLLAQAAPGDLDLVQSHGQSDRIFGMAIKDFLLITGILLTLALLLFAVAWYTRRDPRKRAAAAAGKRVLYRATETGEDSARKVKLRKKRREHPDNLPRNPTLAEAGGLPPIREEPAEPAC